MTWLTLLVCIGYQHHSYSHHRRGSCFSLPAGGKTTESSPPTGSQICRMLPFSLLVVDRKPHQPLPSMYKILDIKRAIVLTARKSVRLVFALLHKGQRLWLKEGEIT